jgi:hypothetical protein
MASLVKVTQMKKAALLGNSAMEPSPNPFAEDGFRLSSKTRKCCCVAVRIGADGTVDIRDTKNVDGPTISYNRDEWSAFIEGVKLGEFDVV